MTRLRLTDLPSRPRAPRRGLRRAGPAALAAALLAAGALPAAAPTVRVHVERIRIVSSQ